MPRPAPQATRYHGDQAVLPGMLDFAVNVRAAAPPSWLVARLADVLRRCDRFAGLDGQFLRAAVREQWPVLAEALKEAMR